MTTAPKLAANRRNASHSTGPRTAEGKAVSRMNAVRHGLLARLPVLPGLEAQKEWQSHIERVFEALRPLGYLEEVLAERIASLLWRLGRAARYEREVMAIQIDLANEQMNEIRENGHKLGNMSVSVETFQAILSFVRRFPRMRGSDPVDLYMFLCILEAAETAVGFRLGKADTERVYAKNHSTAADLGAVLDTIAQDKQMPRHALLELTADEVESTLLTSQSEEEEAETDVDRQCRRSLIPPGARMDKLIRYEGHLERSFYKALHELQRLHAGRSGAHVPVPAALDVTVDGGFVSQIGSDGANG